MVHKNIYYDKQIIKIVIIGEMKLLNPKVKKKIRDPKFYLLVLNLFSKSIVMV